MPDKPIIEFEAGCYYHIYNHGNSSDNLFVENANYYFFLKRLNYFTQDIIDLNAWCLLPNHFHLLIRVKENFINKENIEVEINHKIVSEQFRHFFTSYSKAINKKYNRRGALFLRSFKRKKVTDDVYLKRVIRYIHMNPVNHGFTKDPLKWHHSSFNKIIENPNYLPNKEIIGLFRDLQDFVEFHRGKVNSQIKETDVNK
ncbi:MAG TPA: transposase [Bacteroidia bacterium]|nr:transposase [Bacteroidia bacterium]